MKWIEIYPIDNTTVVHCIYHFEQLGTATQQFHDYCHCVLTLNKKQMNE